MQANQVIFVTIIYSSTNPHERKNLLGTLGHMGRRMT